MSPMLYGPTMLSRQPAARWTFTSITPGSGRDGEGEPGIRGRRIALDHHRQLAMGRRVLDRRNQLDEVVRVALRREKDVQPRARLDAQRGADRRGAPPATRTAR
jgi:hypothetical protein